MFWSGDPLLSRWHWDSRRSSDMRGRQTRHHWQAPQTEKA